MIWARSGSTGPLQVAQGPGKILLLQGRQHQVAVVAWGSTPESATGPASTWRPRRTSKPRPSILSVFGFWFLVFR